ncbi:MAG: T9SS type A sorting domain-containing protein, partial [bacterium]
LGDGRAYIADGASGLRMIDISESTNPHEVGYYDTPGYAQSVHVSGSYAYVADGWCGLRIISVSGDPVFAREVGHYDTPGYAADVFGVDSHVYVADMECGFQIYEFLTECVPGPGRMIAYRPVNLLQNPTRGDYLRVRIGGAEAGDIMLEVYNVLGQRVGSFAVSSGDCDIDLRSSGLSSGVYFLRLADASTSKPVKSLIIK